MNEHKLSRRGFYRTLFVMNTISLTGCISGQQEPPDDPEFLWEYSADSNHPYGVVSITHDGGEKVPVSDVGIRGERFTEQPSMDYDIGTPGNWKGNGQATGIKGEQTAIKPGDSIRVGVFNDYHLMIVFFGDAEFTLSEDWGPMATSTSRNELS